MAVKIEKLDLHGLIIDEALKKTMLNINWCIRNSVHVLDINHGKGYHSSRNFSVVKQEIRKTLKDLDLLKAHDYKVVYGESDLPVALAYDEGHTLIVQKGLENQYLGGARQIEKNRQVFSREGRKERKVNKSINAHKRE